MVLCVVLCECVSTLTLCKVVYMFQQCDITLCCVVHADVSLSYVSLSQGREAAAEGGEEDRQHPKVQKVPSFN